ncbi:MAG: extracellular solute-binding protein [Nocardioides sp.]|nr:extracellular solute-binding protein [Nocardioides sp.]
MRRTNQTAGRGRWVRASGLAAAATLAASLLASCGDSGAGATTLTWYINPDDGGQAEIAQRCSERADGAYTIETSLLPRDAPGQREQLVRRLAAGDTSIDLMSLDPPFVPEFAEAGFLADIPDDVEAEVTEDVLQGAVDGATWKDELVAIPFWANTQILWYRTSVAEAAGLDLENELITWDQMIEVAEEQGVTIAAQGTRAESLTVWINALVAGAGGQIIQNPEAPTDQIELGLESEAGSEAARIMHDVATSDAAPPGFTTADENASMLAFRADDAGFMVNYPFVWPATKAAVEDGSYDQADLDDWNWALFPATVEGEQAAPPLGGIDIGVSAQSEKTDLAFEASRCIVSLENQTYYFISNGNPAAKAAAFDDPEVQEAFPMAQVLRDSLQAAAPRPQTAYYNEVSTGLQKIWHPPGALDPDRSPQEATELIVGVLRGDRLL